LFSLTTEEEENALELPGDVVLMQQNLPQTPYSLLMSRARKTGVEEVEKTSVTGTMGEAGAEVLNQVRNQNVYIIFLLILPKKRAPNMTQQIATTND
jgi:hypothetical protein